VKRMFNEQLSSQSASDVVCFPSILTSSERSKKQSAKFVELEELVKELFREARESSEERTKVCKVML